jgi:hypothetical protein
MEFKIKALNRMASIGDLYDARTLSIANGVNCFKNSNYESLIKSIDSTEQRTIYIDNEKLNEKFTKLDISASMKVDLKLANLSGSGKYISEEKKSKRSVMLSLYHYIKTKYENIYLTNEQVKSLLDHVILTKYKDATHIIVGIQWGSNSVATFECENNDNLDTKLIKGAFDAKLNNAFSTLVDVNANANVDYIGSEQEIDRNFKLTFVSDTIAKDRGLPQSIEDVKDYFAKIPIYIKDINKGKGIPLEYTLFDINQFLTMINIKSEIERSIKEIEFNKFDTLNKELCSLSDLKQELNDYVQDINENKTLFDKEFVKKANEMKSNVETNEGKFRKELKNVLDSVRSAKEQSSKIDEILNEFISSKYSSVGIQSYLNENLKNKEKLDIINDLKSNKIEFLIENPDSFKLNTKNTDKNVFILFTSESLKKENVNWNEIFLFYLYFSKEYIEIKIINNNLFDSNKEIFKLNRARCSNVNYNLKPVTKMNSLLKVNCPNYSQCSINLVNWICEKCETNYVYGFDQKLYCQCGGGECKDFTFKCSDSNHPNEFIKYKTELGSILDKYYGKYLFIPIQSDCFKNYFIEKCLNITINMIKKQQILIIKSNFL